MDYENLYQPGQAISRPYSKQYKYRAFFMLPWSSGNRFIFKSHGDINIS